MIRKEDRDYTKDFQMPWDKVVDKIERSAADNLDSGGRIERVIGVEIIKEAKP